MKFHSAVIIAIVATTVVTEIMASPATKPTSDAPSKPTSVAPKPTSAAPSKPTSDAPKPTSAAPPKSSSAAPDKPTSAAPTKPTTGGASTNGLGASALALTACLVTKYLF